MILHRMTQEALSTRKPRASGDDPATAEKIEEQIG